MLVPTAPALEPQRTQLSSGLANPHSWDAAQQPSATHGGPPGHAGSHGVLAGGARKAHAEAVLLPLLAGVGLIHIAPVAGIPKTLQSAETDPPQDQCPSSTRGCLALLLGSVLWCQPPWSSSVAAPTVCFWWVGDGSVKLQAASAEARIEVLQHRQI